MLSQFRAMLADVQPETSPNRRVARWRHPEARVQIRLCVTHPPGLEGNRPPREAQLSGYEVGKSPRVGGETRRGLIIVPEILPGAPRKSARCGLTTLGFGRQSVRRA